MKIWKCKIGEVYASKLPQGADGPMREAVERAYREITGEESDFLFSGWDSELTEGERAVVENRAPNEPPCPHGIPHGTPCDDCVICPGCCHQFPAIPVNVQTELSSALAAQPGQGEKYGWPVREDFDASKGRYEKCDACWGYPTKPGQDQCRKCAGMGGHLYYPAVTPLTPAHDEAGVRAEWQPLDTAPKDGTHILIAWKGSNADLWHTTIGYWRTHHGDYEKDTHKHWAMVRVTDPSLTSMGPEEIRDWVRWMPLPNPPGYRAALLGETK